MSSSPPFIKPSADVVSLVSSLLSSVQYCTVTAFDHHITPLPDRAESIAIDCLKEFYNKSMQILTFTTKKALFSVKRNKIVFRFS